MILIRTQVNSDGTDKVQFHVVLCTRSGYACQEPPGRFGTLWNIAMFATCARTTMPHFLLLAVSVIGLSFAGCGSTAAQKTTVPQGFDLVQGKPQAPPTLFSNVNGDPISLKFFRGKVVVLNLWATWCAPCVTEMPSLDRLASRFESDRLVVLAVSQDKGGSAVVTPFLMRLALQKLKIFADPSGRLFRDFGVRGLPTTFIIDPSGATIARVEGPLDWDAGDVVRYLTGMVEQPSR